MKKTIALICSLNFVVANVSSQTNNPPAIEPPRVTTPQATAPEAQKPALDPINDPGVRKLSRRDRKDRIKNLTETYQNFLKDVEPIIMPTELNAFLQLESDAQREVYIEAFWKLRDSDRKTIYNEYRETYYERLGEAKEKFKYLTSERSRTYLVQGRPDTIVKSDCPRYLQPIEVWYYDFLQGKGHKVYLLFYEPRNGSDYVLWQQIGRSGEDMDVLLSVDGQRLGAAEVFQGSSGGGRVSRVAYDCPNGDAVLSAMYWMQSNRTEAARLWDPPAVDQEEVRDILRAAVLSNPNAPRLKAAFSVRYPGKRGARTDTEMTIELDASQLTAKEIGGVKSYSIDLTGEVLKEEKMFETFRYRFDFPADPPQAKLPITIERFLRPADYKPRIKVVDANSGAEALIESAISVPQLQDSAELVAQRQESQAALTKLQSEIRSGEDRLRIVPLADSLLSGLQHIETLITGSAIKAVEFYLDGKRVMVKRSPPFTLDLDFGEVPQVRRIKAVGLDATGKIVTGDDLTLNTGTDEFKVRIAHPRVATNVSGRIRVEIEPSIPEGKTLARVELYLNEQKLATIYDPPFVQTVTVPANQAVGYLRAVATLKDSDVTPVEDVVFINTPGFIEQVDVHLVELPTTVLKGGRPLSGLAQASFSVTDEGKPAKISKFEYVTKLPLSLGLTVDTSESMRPRMLEAQKAGSEFFTNILRPGDKAFVVAFSSQPTLIQKWTARLSDLNAGVSSMRAEQATAIFDAIVFSLYNFQGIKGQKALVVLTDGKDTASRFTFEQSLEYARRAAVPIYTIGLGIKTTDVDARFKMGRFSNETGGNVFYIEKASDLQKIYAAIQEELRSQYLIGFYPPEGVKSGSKWRTVTVEAKEGKAKTIRGYYP
ncbi:MAG TPA: VWA domain-containing protein [Thermoanaerobaculia bacterium]|nr:VWA domain-containing protein [Thermoanaerobaculia bacterium]